MSEIVFLIYYKGLIMNVLNGRYKLISHGIFDCDGVFHPTSPYLKGELIYSSEGYLSVQIYFQEDPKSNRDFLTYSGNYVVSSSVELLHNISICSQIHRNSTVEKRNYRFEDNILFLSLVFEDKRKFEAKWERLSI